MASASLDDELNSLKATLSQTREKIISQWMGDELKTRMSEQSKKHEQFVQRSEEEIKQRQANVENLKQKVLCGEQSLEERVQNLEQLKMELQKVVSETDDVLRARESTELQLDQTKAQLSKEREVLANEGQGVQEKLVELDKAATMFRDRLGFNMKKTKDDWLQFIFRYIDHEDPEKPFYFFLKIEGQERQYKVSGCEPPVEDLSILVDKLNKTNSLKSFIVAMRKRFKDSTVASKKKS